MNFSLVAVCCGSAGVFVLWVFVCSANVLGSVLRCFRMCCDEICNVVRCYEREGLYALFGPLVDGDCVL